MSEDERTLALMGHVNGIMRALLVAAKHGAPAEGQLPFNPLYFNILRVVAAKGTVRPSEIADVLRVSRTTISTAVKSLKTRGLLEAGADESDGRAVHLRLTPTGQETRDAILRQDIRNAAAMLATLDETERDAFVATMGRVATGLSEMAPDGTGSEPRLGLPRGRSTSA